LTERVYLDWNATTPLRPQARAAMIAALDAPVGAAPLRTQVAGKKVVFIHTDITRATPNDRLIPWLLAYLEPVRNPIVFESHGKPRRHVGGL